MRRLEGIQLLRGVAALAVLLFHIATLSTDYAGGVLFAPFAHVGAAGVDLFFVVSGFVMAATTHDHFDRPGAAARFAIHRASRVYPPYWIVSAFLAAYYLHDPAGVNAKQGGADLLSSFLLLPSPLLPLLPVAWTLVHEVFFYGVFLLAIGLLPRRLLAAALCAWAALAVARIVAAPGLSTTDWKTFVLHPFNLEFIAGALVGVAWRRREVLFARLAVPCTALGIAAFAAVAMHLQMAGAPDAPGLPQRVVVFGVPSVLLVAGCLGLRFERRGWRGALARAGDCSYSLYLTHILLVHAGYRLVTRKLGVVLDLPTNLALAVVLAAGCIAVGWGFHRLVERPACALALRLLERLATPGRVGQRSA